jgi:flagellar basal-body rod protein FlgC
MNLFGVLAVSGSALAAERVRAEVTASNMANAQTTRTIDGQPFQRQHVIFQTAARNPGELSSGGLLSGSFSSTFGAHLAGFAPLSPLNPSGSSSQGGGIPIADRSASLGGVEIAGIVSDRGAGLRRYDPQHPDADKDGYVTYPDIDPLTEMVDLMGATRAYGLNVSAVQATKTMISSSLDLLK